ncbi:ABC transporter substrate-binding protein [Intestinimonas butyriciproducens]|uniref:ABC transporter substrate-binding protein n=1 Tax=Intestinimonas butyriciproducens TaxID=1297617 RepID=UPI00195BF87E|nr:ABC transporter substrate-binding protein [Intestinimonas butyriciproducens]MBM6918943.1 ABC transporter substrate-binding protein [Intestinimonas butyriciproducens]
MKKKTRILSFLLATVMASGLLAGCSSDGGDKDSGKEDGGKKDSIVIATMGETPSLSPTEHNAVAGSYMNILTYNTLFKTSMDLEPVPDLVDSYENVDDSTWHFKLKEGVKFHNGDTMTADDVVASLQWAQGFAEVNLYNKNFISISKVDDLTVEIKTDGPDAMVLSNLTSHGNAVVPKKLIDEGHDFNADPIGTGPYKLVEWKRGDSLEFEAFEDYFEGAPSIKHMTWKIIPEGSSRTIALEAGEIDFIIEVEAMDADRLKENSDLSVIEYNATNLTWLMLNNEVPGLDNQDVRHAINTAIDKESVVTVAYNGMATPALSQMPMNFEGATEENADTYDVEKAKEWLEKSGVDPASVQFSIICSDDTKKRAGEVIQANLKEIGINCEIESMDLATYLSATAEGDFTAAIGGYSSDSLLSYVVGVYHSSSINASNKTRLNNPEVDALIDKAKITVDAAERKPIMEELSALLNEICSQAPIYQPISMRAFDARLQGVEITDGGTIFWQYVSWGE